MITNADITIYNKYYDRTTRKDIWLKTHIHGVSWYGGQKVTVADKGLLSADSYTVRIPLESAPQGKSFVLSDEFAKLDETGLNSHWTLQNGDVICQGERTEDIPLTKEALSCGRFVVTGWSDNRRGGLQHWKVEGGK
ncbi:DUF6751 family protein [Scatolibacter rhodanostii]|uniref:DUF6751 family protein n=1 Tax=Scatolibacter rhodanostii TaxID=2014781 RepID=UPI000C08BD36|nr:DUF6751 family protein [Scatolibacter rhodanostii]